MTPSELDAAINGAKVHIYRRPDRSVYASVHDYSRFGIEPLETVRVKLTPTSTVAEVETHAKVMAAIKRHAR